MKVITWSSLGRLTRLNFGNPSSTQVSCVLIHPPPSPKDAVFMASKCVGYIILPHKKFLQFDWLRAVVFQLNLKYLHVKITNLLRVVV